MGQFFEEVRKQNDYIIYEYFMFKYISCQYNDLVIVAWIQLNEIKVKRGELRRWKMVEADHEHIMETCIPITHWRDE